MDHINLCKGLKFQFEYIFSIVFVVLLYSDSRISSKSYPSSANFALFGPSCSIQASLSLLHTSKNSTFFSHEQEEKTVSKSPCRKNIASHVCVCSTLRDHSSFLTTISSSVLGKGKSP